MSSDPLTVLVVDDNRMMRGMVVRAVRLSGLPLATVLEAGDGAEALVVVASHPVDLVLLDLNMPLLDGEAFLVRLRGIPRLAATPVLVVSTESAPARIARLKALGAGFVHKPFTPEELVTAVAALHAGAP